MTLYMLNERFLTTKQAAAHLSICEKTLLDHVAKGNLECVDVGTGTRAFRRFSPNQLEQFTRRLQKLPPCPSTREVRTAGVAHTSVAPAFSDIQKPTTRREVFGPLRNQTKS
ncbi:helix-turn-helix domain-containing protein [Ensifer adhaerens]